MTRRNSSETIQFLTQEEMEALLKAIPNRRDKAIFLIAYRHGLRASELGMLQISDIDFKAQRIKLHRLKGSLDDNHTMQPDEVRLLKSYLRNRKVDSPYLFATNRGTPISRASLDYFMKKYGKQAGIPEDKRHFHTLKHSIATHLLDAGADIMFVKDWLGHKNIQNTIVYSQLTSKTRNEQAGKIFASPRIV